MEELAVFWRDSGEPDAIYGGGAAIESGRLRLRGSDGRARVVRTVPGADVAVIAPGGADEAIGEFPSVRLELRNGGSIVLAAVVGGAVFARLVESLVSLLSG